MSENSSKLDEIRQFLEDQTDSLVMIRELPLSRDLMITDRVGYAECYRFGMSPEAGYGLCHAVRSLADELRFDYGLRPRGGDVCIDGLMCRLGTTETIGAIQSRTSQSIHITDPSSSLRVATVVASQFLSAKVTSEPLVRSIEVWVFETAAKLERRRLYELQNVISA